MNLEGWVVIREIQGSFEEEHVRAFLGANGIAVRSRGEALRHTHAMVLDGLGRVEIMVPSEQKDQALDLLKQVDEGVFRLAELSQSDGEDDTD